MRRLCAPPLPTKSTSPLSLQLRLPHNRIGVFWARKLRQIGVPRHRLSSTTTIQEAQDMFEKHKQAAQLSSRIKTTPFIRNLLITLGAKQVPDKESDALAALDKLLSQQQEQQQRHHLLPSQPSTSPDHRSQVQGTPMDVDVQSKAGPPQLKAPTSPTSPGSHPPTSGVHKR